jgi:hypothetical protein
MEPQIICFNPDSEDNNEINPPIIVKLDEYKVERA